MPGRKRLHHEVIDLTNDSDQENSIGHDNKRSKQQSKQNTERLATSPANRPPYATPPLSSQSFSSSQPSSTRQKSHVQIYQGNRLHSSEEAANGIPSAFIPVDESDDISQAVDLTQDSDEEDNYENRQLYGILHTKVVGIRFYNGCATEGEYVMIHREPSNAYDRNAIRIDNVQNTQIGHIKRQVAAKLAPLMDTGDLLVQGTLTGEMGQFDCPISLKLFGWDTRTVATAKVESLKKRMHDAKLPLTELSKAEKDRAKREKEMEKQRKAREKAADEMRKQGNVVFDLEGGARQWCNFIRPGEGLTEDEDMIENLLNNGVSYNPRDVEDAVSKIGCGEEALSKMPTADQPKELITQLLPYQKQGLQWMLEKESPKVPSRNSNDTVQLWKSKNGMYTNIATSFSVSNAPELASGGILADDMGLGKTIQIISLIMADPRRKDGPTLIISPLSVMSNWSFQASQHTKKNYAPSVYIYHGQENRGLSAQELEKFDIVITTYQTMTLELFPNNSKEKNKPIAVPTSKGIFSLKWRRIVLDEGHSIRNAKAKMSRAACSLMADSRWVLTGTPIVNSLKDLYSHVKFLQLGGGLSEFEIFNANVIQPLRNGNESARLLLQALMQSLCLRRMKSMDFVDLKLPNLSFHKILIDFHPHEKEQYDAFKAEAKGLVEAAKQKKGDKTMTYLLEVLLRLRQTCNHWRLCGEKRVSRLMALMRELEEGDKMIDIFNDENRKALQDLLQLKMDNQEDCPICMETLVSNKEDDGNREARITACAHAFCSTCIERIISTQQKCPMCRTELPSLEHIVAAAPTNTSQKEDNCSKHSNRNASTDDTGSSKVEAIISLLTASRQKQPNQKTVLFSQWTSFLRVLEPYLDRHGIAFTRLDGTMSPLSRDAAISQFCLTEIDSPQLLLATYGVSAVGLNLTAASQVILADSWWAPAVEDQAVDRVYRLGQTKDVKVIRFLVRGTIEEEVVGRVQRGKRELAGLAFGGGQGQNEREDEGGAQHGGRNGRGSGRLREIEMLLQ